MTVKTERKHPEREVSVPSLQLKDQETGDEKAGRGSTSVGNKRALERKKTMETPGRTSEGGKKGRAAKRNAMPVRRRRRTSEEGRTARQGDK